MHFYVFFALFCPDGDNVTSTPLYLVRAPFLWYQTTLTTTTINKQIIKKGQPHNGSQRETSQWLPVWIEPVSIKKNTNLYKYYNKRGLGNYRFNGIIKENVFDYVFHENVYAHVCQNPSITIYTITPYNYINEAASTNVLYGYNCNSASSLRSTLTPRVCAVFYDTTPCGIATLRDSF